MEILNLKLSHSDAVAISHLLCMLDSNLSLGVEFRSLIERYKVALVNSASSSDN